MKFNIIILLFISIIVYLFYKKHFLINFDKFISVNTNIIKNPCTDFLSNKEYLIHMIPHHQVAIDMCNLMIPISKSKTIQNIYRTIIWNQNIEIVLMNEVLTNIPVITTEINILYRDRKFITSISYNNKSKAKNYYCDPLFFKPDNHSEHMKHMKHTDKSFLEHMIPHHQVAIIMSNRLLKHTNSTHMIRICYAIITSQRSEILKMNYILEYLNENKLDFLPDYY